MTDTAPVGGADAPVTPSSAPIDTNPQTHSNPLGSQVPPADEVVEQGQPEKGKEAEKPADKGEKKPETVRDAIRKASEEVKAKREAEAKAKEEPAKEPEKAKEAAKTEAKPDEKAKADEKQPEQAAEKAQEAQKPADAAQTAEQANSPHKDAPQRFDDAAKADWANAPESIKGATHRAISELEKGIEKYKPDAEAYNEIREYDDMAKQHGTTVKQALSNYVEMEKLLASKPLEGLDALAQKMYGTSIHQLAQQIVGQKPDEVNAHKDRQIAQLSQQVQQLTQQINGVTQNLTQQRTQSVQQQIAEFSQSHPRVAELESDMAFFLKSGRAKTLPEAYDLAEKLNPAPQPSAAHTGNQPALAQTQAPAPKPVNPAGQKSVSGAPTTGSDPVGKKGPTPSIREALKHASARAG